MAKNIIGVCESPRSAIQVINNLVKKGYHPSEISVITNRKDKDMGNLSHEIHAEIDQEPSNDKDSQSFVDKLKDFFAMDDHHHDKEDSAYRAAKLGIPLEEFNLHTHELEKGNFLIAVDSSKLKEEDRHAYTHAESDFMDSPNSLSGTSPNLTNHSVKTDEEKKLNLHEEVLNVDKQNVNVDELEVKKDVVTEEQHVEVPVKHDEVYVERRPVSDKEAHADAFDSSDTIRVPIQEEQVEVTKKPVVKEEVVIGKKTVEETEHVSETVKKEELNVNEHGKNKRVANKKPVNNSSLYKKQG